MLMIKKEKKKNSRSDLLDCIPTSKNQIYSYEMYSIYVHELLIL